MRKSNWIIVGILVVASIFFLWLWYYLHFNLVDNPLDLVLTIVWWVVVIAACLVIRKVEKTRQERVRTTYVMADGTLFNPEAGRVYEKSEFPAAEDAEGANDDAADAAAATPLVDAIQRVLEGLEYNFDMQDAPDPKKVEYRWVVRSKSFEVESDEQEQAVDATAAGDVAEAAATAAKQGTAEVEGADAAAATAADDAPAPLHVVKKWEGEVADVKNPDADPVPFASREELAALLAA